MRILFATTRGAGHLGPLVPFAHACVAAGHQVRVAAAPSVEHHVRRSGLPFEPVDEPDAAIMATAWDAVRSADRADQPRVVFAEVFAGEFARSALPRMRELAQRWRPDVIVRETSEFASVVVADAIGAPTVHVACFLSGVGERDLGLDEALDRLRPGLRMPAGEPFLTLAPPSLEQPEVPGAHRFRAPRAPARALPDWWGGSAEPLVYVSFGSSAAGNGFFPDIYREAAAALAELEVRVLLTLGTEVDPADLGPVPHNVHVEPWVPQGAVMAHAAAMVGHGGSGSTLAAMAAGIPLAVLPLFADQPENAGRVAALGAGLRLDGTGALAETVSELLEDPYYRDGARAVAAEIEALEPVDAAVALIAGEELAQAA
jgi:UDP:flavonoid glycosyltransferase YjiC (YdhE family)